MSETKAKASYTKTLAGLFACVAVAASIYAKLMLRSQSPAIEAGQCALGKYPLANQIEIKDFQTLVGNSRTGRPHNVFVLFNALAPAAGCQACPKVDEMFQRVAAEFPTEIYLKHKIALATVELGNARDIFLMKNIQTAPWLVFFKAFKAGEKEPEMISFNIRKPMDIPGMTGFIGESVGDKIVLQRPKTPADVAIGFGGLVFGTAVLVALALGKLNRVIHNQWVIFALTVSFVIAMTSGVMFCRVRGISLQWAAYAAANRIASGMQSQTGAEAWIIGTLTAVNAASVVIIGSAIPRIQNPVGKRLAALTFTAVVIYGFSTQVQMFRSKFPMYPFKLLL